MRLKPPKQPLFLPFHTASLLRQRNNAISNETKDEKHDKLIRIIIKINIIRVCVPDNITQKYKIHCTVVFRPMYDAPPDGAMVADVSQETGNRKPNSQINY